MLRQLEGQFPRKAIPFAGLGLVVMIGLIDYVTEDYSILIFYLLPVALVFWFHGRTAGMIVSLASGLARFFSDAALYRNIFLHYWNSVQDLLFLVVAGLLVSFLRKELKGGTRRG